MLTLAELNTSLYNTQFQVFSSLPMSLSRVLHPYTICNSRYFHLSQCHYQGCYILIQYTIPGIFISPNVIIKGVGSMGLSLVIWTVGGLLSLCGMKILRTMRNFCYTVKPRYNAGRGRKNFEAKNRVIARSAL